MRAVRCNGPLVPRVIPTCLTVSQRTRVKAGRSKVASSEAYRPGTFDAATPAGTAMSRPEDARARRTEALLGSHSPVAERTPTAGHRRMADCHPRRRLFRESLCGECFQLRSEPLRLGQVLPPRVRDVEQRTVISVPERCPECDGLVYGQAPSAADPALARRMACAICGWDAYLTSDVVVPG